MMTLLLSVLLGASLDANSFTYEGSFRFSDSWQPNNQTLDYSNGCFCVLPNGNLLVTGHVYGSLVKEFVVPAALAKTKSVSAMPAAASVGGWVNIKAGLNVTGQQIWGMTYRPRDGRIWFQNSTDYQDAANPLNALCCTSWPAVAPQGPWSVSSTWVWNTGKYITVMPDGRLLVGRRRHSWGSSEGHNASFVTVPDTLPAAGSALPGKLAMSYCAWQGTNFAACYSKEQSEGDNYMSIAYVEGTIALGCVKDWDVPKSYYGYENWTLPNQCEPTNTCQGQRGHRAGDAHPTLLLIDPAAMTGGDVDWYARVDLGPYFVARYGPTFLSTGASGDTVICSYDASRKRLYVSESYADSARPVVHVFSVAGGTVVVPPPPPPPAVPTKIVISWSHNGLDINGQIVALTGSEVRVFSAGSGPSGTPLFVVPGGTSSAEFRDVLAVPGNYSAFVRVRSAAGWSSYSPAIPFAWPPTAAQPSQIAKPLTVPQRVTGAKAEAKP